MQSQIIRIISTPCQYQAGLKIRRLFWFLLLRTITNVRERSFLPSVAKFAKRRSNVQFFKCTYVVIWYFALLHWRVLVELDRLWKLVPVYRYRHFKLNRVQLPLSVTFSVTFFSYLLYSEVFNRFIYSQMLKMTYDN